MISVFGYTPMYQEQLVLVGAQRFPQIDNLFGPWCDHTGSVVHGFEVIFDSYQKLILLIIVTYHITNLACNKFCE